MQKGGDIHAITSRRKARTAKMGFAKMGADGIRVSTFCFSIWLHIQLDVINLAVCKSSTFIYKFSFS
jgi:hypothetical protein